MYSLLTGYVHLYMDVYMENTIGERLREFRKSKDLKQVPFCEQIGISSGYLSEVENGKKTPGGDILISLLREFPDIDIRWLLIGNEPKRKTTASENNWHEEYIKLLGRYEEAKQTKELLIEALQQNGTNRSLQPDTGRTALETNRHLSGVKR